MLSQLMYETKHTRIVKANITGMEFHINLRSNHAQKNPMFIVSHVQILLAHTKGEKKIYNIQNY